MKKKIVLFVSGLLLVSAFLCGCSSSGSGTVATTGSDTTSGSSTGVSGSAN